MFERSSRASAGDAMRRGCSAILLALIKSLVDLLTYHTIALASPRNHSREQKAGLAIYDGSRLLLDGSGTECNCARDTSAQVHYIRAAEGPRKGLASARTLVPTLSKCTG